MKVMHESNADATYKKRGGRRGGLQRGPHGLHWRSTSSSPPKRASSARAKSRWTTPRIMAAEPISHASDIARLILRPASVRVRGNRLHSESSMVEAPNRHGDWHEHVAQIVHSGAMLVKLVLECVVDVGGTHKVRRHRWLVRETSEIGPLARTVCV